MNSLRIRCTGAAQRLLTFLSIAALLAACSGAVSDNTPIPATPISILPGTATLFANVPTTFVVTGGNGSYVAVSSDQSTLPVASTFTGNTLVVVPNAVAAETPVTLTIRDTGSATPATATLTVKPRTVNNSVQVIPSATQAAACGLAVCAGGDAEVRATLTQNGLPLAGRPVRFDVLSGDVRIITSAAGTSETLALSGTTISDGSGVASMRIRVLNDATAQTALLQITDLNSGFTQRTSVTIAPSSNAPLSAQPTTISFTGPTNTSCANNLFADVIVFGGHPPYQISQPGTFIVSPTVVGNSGGRFTVSPNGQCTASSAIGIVDSSGASITVTASNVLGTQNTATPLVVEPKEVTLENCSSVATVALAGGLGPASYFGASGSGTVKAFTNGTNVGFITRQPSNTAPGGDVTVSFSDGKTAVPVTVHFSDPTLKC